MTRRPYRSGVRAARPVLDGLESRELLSAVKVPHAEVVALRATLRHSVPTIAQLPTAPTRTASTVPDNGDVNPYGVAFVPMGRAISDRAFPYVHGRAGSPCTSSPVTGEVFCTAQFPVTSNRIRKANTFSTTAGPRRMSGPAAAIIRNSRSRCRLRLQRDLGFSCARMRKWTRFAARSRTRS